MCLDEKTCLRVCEQQSRRPACASAQADQCLWKVWYINLLQVKFVFLASLYSWGDWFESRFVGNRRQVLSYQGPYGSAHEILIFITYAQKPPLIAHSNTLPEPLLLSNFAYARCEGAGKTVQMRRLVWIFDARRCDKYQNLTYWLVLKFYFITFVKHLCLIKPVYIILLDF